MINYHTRCARATLRCLEAIFLKKIAFVDHAAAVVIHRDMLRPENLSCEETLLRALPIFQVSVTLTPASRVHPSQRSESAQTSSASKRPVDLRQRRGIFLRGYAFSASTKSLPHGQRDDTSAVSRLHCRRD